MKSSGTTLEKKKWYKNAMAVITAIGALLGVAASLRSYFSGPKPVAENTEIVLDTSAAMNQEFEGTTKIQAAAKAVGVILETVSDKDNLALREFGGSCEGDNPHRTIKLTTKNVQNVRDAVQDIRPSGQTTMTHAVIEAIGDFNDPNRFKGVGKRILVITGSDEACFPSGSASDPMREAIAAIQDRLERAKRSGSDIQLDFRFVGIGLTVEQEKNLRAVAKATNGKVKFVHHLNELKKVILNEIQATPAETASVVKDGTALVSTLNACGVHLKDVLTAIQKSDFSAADDSLREASEEWTRSESPFLELGGKQSAEQFQKLYSLAKQNREIEQRLITLAKTMLSQARAHDRAGYDGSRLEFDKLSADYERHGQEIDQLLKELE